MTTVYLDTYLVMSLAVNYVLLRCAGRLDGDRTTSFRCLTAASLGAVLGAISLLPWGGFLAHPAGQAAAGAGMVLTAYGSSDRLLRTGGLFLVLSCAWAGGLLLLSRSAVFSGQMGLRGILVSAALGYGGLSLGLRGQFRHTRTGGDLVPLRLSLDGRTLSLLALRDTGLSLTDPLTGGPVVIVESPAIKPLLPGLNLDPEAEPVELLARARAEMPGTAFQLLPYRAVGVEHGLLLAIRLDRAEWAGKKVERCLAALSPTPVSGEGGYQALVSG